MSTLRRYTAFPSIEARCEDCRWTTAAKNAKATAATHARTHRHRTHVREAKTTIFDGLTFQRPLRRTLA